MHFVQRMTSDSAIIKEFWASWRRSGWICRQGDRGSDWRDIARSDSSNYPFISALRGSPCPSPVRCRRSAQSPRGLANWTTLERGATCRHRLEGEVAAVSRPATAARDRRQQSDASSVPISNVPGRPAATAATRKRHLGQRSTLSVVRLDARSFKPFCIGKRAHPRWRSRQRQNSGGQSRFLLIRCAHSRLGPV